MWKLPCRTGVAKWPNGRRVGSVLAPACRFAMTSDQPTYRQMLFDLERLGVGTREVADRTQIAYATLRRQRYADYAEGSIPYFRLQRLWKQHKALCNASVSIRP
jgi:hypothetical protein